MFAVQNSSYVVGHECTNNIVFIAEGSNQNSII